ncbi:MAG: heparinase II/III family protein, partial [Armatimonadota bacterium]
ILEHIEYHCANAYKWTRDRCKLHLTYQSSHGQQCMHALCTTVMAIAGDSEPADEWFDWLVRQYANRLAWGAEDGGYTEGQTYSHKYRMILDALLAIRTATGIDIFQKPRVGNSGDFWLYCMSLNYWYNHWGDVYSLLMPMYGNNSEASIANIIAARTDNRHLKWYSRETVADPASQPYWYLSETDLQPKPPVDIAQGRLFPDVGQLAAYDRFYDHKGNRIFFRSSPWGSHSHAHADQNGFVIHTGGEIMACDAGYYTHYGDDYHRNFSVATIAHNSLLVNGEGQPKSITSRGKIAGIFDTPTYCSFVGEAAEAYAGKLEVFDRIIVFIRPNVFVCYDELDAPEPSEFSWLFHSFEAADIDEDSREMVIKQREQRLRVQHLAPETVTYEQSNERPYPMETRRWCRFTDNCPQQYTIKANTAAAEQERILTLMDAYDVEQGSSVSDAEEFGDERYTGLRFRTNGMTERVIFQKRDTGRITADGDIQTDARVTSVAQRDGAASRWMLYEGSRLQVGGEELFRANRTCYAALDGEIPGAARIWLKCSEPLKASVALDDRPHAMYIAPPYEPEAAQAMEVDYSAGRLHLELDQPGEVVVWVDPARNPSEPLSDQQMIVRDERGTWTVDLERAYADSGEIVAFGELGPRQPGEFTVTAPGADILLQDQWDPQISTRGTSEVTGTIREATEIFVRYAPGETPELRADLTQPATGEIVNLLRNGGFEAGIPEYPPRGWTIGHGRDMAKTWPEWSHEDPYSGESHLKFVRPELYMVLRSQPMRLRTAGTYVLRFMARGNATEASVRVSGKMGTSAAIELEPSDQWREYRQEIDVKPGQTLITITMGNGGEPDQVLYLDEMEFGYIAP